VNSDIRISTRSGSTLATVGFAAFFAEAAAQVSTFDPRVLWDGAHSRWIATATSFDCTAGHLYLAISSGSDPMGAWTSYQFDFSGAVPDYPGLGSSSDKVVLSANEFPIVPLGGSCDLSEPGTGASLLIVDWSDLLTAGSVSGRLTTANPTLFTWRPATALTPTATLPAVVMVANGSAWDVGYATISGTNAAGNVVVSAVQDLTTLGIVASFLSPPIPLGATAFTANTVDPRPTDALWQNGMLWFVSTYPCSPGGDPTTRDCVRATELATGTATPSLSQDFLAGTASYDFFMGGIGLASDRTLYLVFSVSSGSTPISTYATSQRVVDAPNSFGPLILVASGAATYAGTRWGDYVGVAQDPVTPNAVWQADEYPDGGGYWTTRITQLFADRATYHALTPGRVLDTRISLGTGTFSSGVPRTFAVTGLAGVPSSATAVTGNLTVVGQTHAGYVALTPEPTASPTTSTLNFPVGDTRANGVTVALGAGGHLSATYVSGRAGDHTQLIFDVTGYFGP
jgi:hypothetical protein